MYELLRPLLFRLDPETAHNLTLGLLRWAGDTAPVRALLDGIFTVRDPRLAVRAFGLEFPNPVGLAAGYDKNGIAVRGAAALGFGHIEVGTVTRLAQPGSPHPRVWRVPEAGALVNRMGFPNAGIARLRLPPRPPGLQPAPLPPGFNPGTIFRVGVNIGKGKDTHLECAADDYIALLTSPALSDADYIAINISSPNTPGLRALQARAAIAPLVRALADARDALPRRLPLLVKIAPDLSDDEIGVIVDAARDAGLDGVIATNTTVSRADVPAYASAYPGGLSGAPLRARSTAIIRHIAAYTRGEFPIIGVGGVTEPGAALEKLQAGASLIQLFTGLVYQGPGLIKQINTALLQRAS